MLTEFLDFIDKNKLFAKEDKILLAVSGGVDSVVMAHLFRQASLNFSIAHCNFNLRGKDSEEDEQFVENLAKKLKVPFYTRRFDTKKYAIENALSTQLAARNLRYDWFLELLKAHQYAYVATAHHLNDAFETVLYNMTKGTGIAGLTGIAKKTDHVVRPLLFATRATIEDFAQAQHIDWREDVSNQSSDYSRNHIRNHVVPLLRDINPSLEDTFKNSQLRLEAVENLVLEALAAFTSDHIEKKGADLFIDKNALKQTNLAVIDELLKPFGYNFSQVLDIKSALSKGGKVFDSKNYRLNIDREKLIISPRALSEATADLIEEGQSEYSHPLFSLKIERKANNAPLSFTSNETKLDFSTLKFPLTVRKWQEGDAFYPLGMKGKKKLSDFMIDNKIPLNLKERVYVLESDGEIVWVIGHRLDERFKVKPTTTHTLNFHLTYHD